MAKAPGLIPAIVKSNERSRLARSNQAGSSSSNSNSDRVSAPRWDYGSTHISHSPASTSPQHHYVGRIEESDEDDQNENGHDRVSFGPDGQVNLRETEYASQHCTEDCHSDIIEFAEPLNVTWKYMSRMYLLVPLATFFFFIALLLLITFAWPPNKHERKHGQTYPHPFLWKPFVVGIFAGCTVQTIRVPLYVIISWLNRSQAFTTYSSTILHSVIHELARLSTIPLSNPSPTSGFHSSYYLGIGWGLAEAVWGIVQGYEQLSLYQDIMKAEDNDEEDAQKDENGMTPDSHTIERARDYFDQSTESDTSSIDDDRFHAAQEADVAELESRVEALERMRERRDLEEVIGVPFPTINLALQILWRLDTLLLNLGLTLILSAYYFDPIPIYKHAEPRNPALGPNHTPSPYLWSVWAVVAFVHVCISVVWRLVGRLGVDAVTWGGLIVALGSVFAGLGGWGGLV